MKQRFFKLIVVALGLLIGMSLLGQEETTPSDAIADASDVDFPNCPPSAYGPGPCFFITID